MGEAGVFGPEARLELIEGEIIEMAPIGSPHAGLVNRSTAIFVQCAAGRGVVSVQNLVIISDRSVPQPDLALLEPRADYYSDAHPTVSDVLLVLEVADSTLAFDMGTKAPLYARGGIAEAWGVDVNERVIHIFRDPGAAGYRTTFTAASGQSVACGALPEALIEVRELFSA